LLVRDVAKARRLVGDRPTFLRGDVRRPETLEPVFTSVNGVICAIGSRDLQGEENPQVVDYQGVQNLVSAAVGTKARARGVLEHFVLVSSIAVTHPEHPLNQYGRVLDWKLKGEEALRASGLTYTIVRPGGLTDAPGGEHALLFDQGDRISGLISRADVAEVCVQALDEPKADNTTFEVIEAPGPASLNLSELFARLRPDREPGGLPA
ncbi:MAG TPA: SDR family oxidoreductase, partial [Anaerolineales bacterium]